MRGCRFDSHYFCFHFWAFCFQKEMAYMGKVEGFFRNDGKWPCEFSPICTVTLKKAIEELFHYFDELEKLLQDDGSRKKSVSMGNENFIIVDKNGNIIDEHAFGINMVRYLQRNGNCKKFTLGMPRHFYQDQLDILEANINDVEKAVGHVINTVSERHYKVNEQYLKRLLPYVEELGIMLENAVKMV